MGLIVKSIKFLKQKNKMMLQKKPFLYSILATIFPDVIEIREKVFNKFGRIEEIYHIQSFNDKTYFQTIQNDGENHPLTHRFYELNGKNPSNSKLINVLFQDMQVKKLLVYPKLAERN